MAPLPRLGLDVARSLWVRTSLLLVAIAAGALAACSRPPQEQVFSGPTMGTTYTVKTLDTGDVTASEIGGRIEATLAEVDVEMSTYRDDSALARFNASTSTDWYPVPGELAAVLEAAQELARLTDGAFDVTVAPLVDLWGFGPQGDPGAVPDPEALAAARARVGYGKLEVRLDPPALRKQRADLEVDLNAIAPGHAVDRIAAQLEAIGVVDYLVDVGGELRVRGRNARGQPWRVAVERPSDGPREVYTVIELDTGAVATSGDYRQYFESNGRRYSHTIDPRTAEPVTHALASVAVVRESAMLADGLATALAVLGPEAGQALVESQHLAALFIVREGSGFSESSTPAFERLRVDGRT
jgi:thiamine biosynthesis lipoprotein